MVVVFTETPPPHLTLPPTMSKITIFASLWDEVKKVIADFSRLRGK